MNAGAGAPGVDVESFPRAWEVLPSWSEVELTQAIGEPFGPTFVPFNPSIHRAPDGTWRCSVRWANTDASKRPRFGWVRTRNVMLHLNPADWSVTGWFEMRELDKTPRAPVTPCVGYEDMRLFWAGGDATSEPGGELRGIACSLMLNVKRSGGVPEQVLVRFDDQYNIVESTPLRGPWTDRAQKNWMPFDNIAEEGRFVYSIDEQVIIDVKAQASSGEPDESSLDWGEGSWEWEPELSEHSGSRELQALLPPAKRNWTCGKATWVAELDQPKPSEHEHGSSKRSNRTGIEMKIQHRPMAVLRSQEEPRIWETGSSNLRGGGQLIKLDDGRWLGIGHEMQLLKERGEVGKLYWHTLFTCDASGKTLERSEPFKLADDGIEFVTGMAISAPGEITEARHVVFSYGVDDVKARLGTALLSEVLALLVEVADIAEPPAEPKVVAPRAAQAAIPARIRLRHEVAGAKTCLLEEWSKPTSTNGRTGKSDLLRQIRMTHDEAREVHAQLGEMLNDNNGRESKIGSKP